jgi:putative oxidoreductase
VTTLAVIAVCLAVAGPGSYSVDQALGIADDLDEWVGLAAIGAGLLASVGQLAVFWRRPRGGSA